MSSPAARAARALLDALAEREPSEDEGDREPLAVAKERLAAGEEAARQTVLGHAQLGSVAGRTAALLAHERTRILLADGSQLSLDEAERRLADKEAQRVFPPLRGALDAAAAPALDALEAAARPYFDTLSDIDTTGELADASAARASLESLLAATRAAGEACLVALEHSGGAAARDPTGLARALDLPGPAGGFSHETAMRLGRALQQAAAARLQRGLVRVKAPRALAGLVLTAAKGPVRVLDAPAFSAGRFSALVEGAATGVAGALLTDAAGGGAPGAADEAARAFGLALGFAVHTPIVRRTVLDEPLAEAERNARQARARALLSVRAKAALARALLVEGEGEGEDRFDLAREALAEALFAPPPPGLVRGLLAPPWPGAAFLRGRLASLGRAALGARQGAALFLGLRERYDESFALVPGPYDLFADAAPALARGHLTPEVLTGATPEPREDPLVTYVAELL